MRYSTQPVSFNFTLTPWVKRLIIANVIGYLLILLLGRELVFEWFAFDPSRILTRPWGAVTYMFLHGGFWHLFVNMIILFFFGPPLEQKWGSREFLKFYLICGLGGVALSFFFVPNWIVGASAAMYGLMLAFAMIWPNNPIYIWGVLPVKAKWLVAFLFVVSLFSAFGQAGDGVAHFAHLGGLLTGFLYLKADWSTSEKLQRLKKAAQIRRRLAIVPRNEEEGGKASDEGEDGRWKKGERPDEDVLDEVDRILDKISERGMGSLTEDELRTLDEVSRKRRSN